MKLDSSEIIDALDKAVSELFETITFSEVTGKLIEDTFPDLKDYSIGASIEIIRPIKAHLSLVLNKTHVQEIYDSVYGDDQDDDILSDLVAEFTNTIAGRFAAAIIRKKESVELGLPVTMEGIFQATENEALENTVVITFDIEDQHVVCCLERGKNSFDSDGVFRIQPLNERELPHGKD